MNAPVVDPRFHRVDDRVAETEDHSFAALLGGEAKPESIVYVLVGSLPESEWKTRVCAIGGLLAATPTARMLHRTRCATRLTPADPT
jgi:hypothetical protein